MYTATAVAKYVINRCNVRNSPITNLKLQKILYYIQGYFFKYLGEAAFDDDIESWRYGPVVPSVYYEYCSYVSSEILVNYDLDDDVQEMYKNKNDCKIINRVVDACETFSAIALVNKTHQEAPWKDSYKEGARPATIISPESVRNFFEGSNPLGVDF